jgi:small-conductance mechanosensitive channel
VLDQPFAVGDFIIVDDLMGTVERVGIKTTRIRSLWGEQLVFSNSNLLNARIRNYQRMRERRIVFTIGSTYQTPADQVRAIPGLIREAIEAAPLTRFDRAHFREFGDSALLFEAVYYVLDPDYNKYMDTQQQINLGLLDRFADRGIDFAYPTQTVFLETAGAVKVALPGRASSE